MGNHRVNARPRARSLPRRVPAPDRIRGGSRPGKERGGQPRVAGLSLGVRIYHSLLATLISRRALIFSALALVSSCFLPGADTLAAVSPGPIAERQVSVPRRGAPSGNWDRVAAASHRATAAQQPLSSAQQQYLTLAQSAVARSERLWRDRHLRWYDAR